MLQNCSKFPTQKVLIFGYVFPRHKWPKSWSNIENRVVPLERNLYVHQLAGLLWERRFEDVLLRLGWGKLPNWECLFVHRKHRLFLSVSVDDVKNGWKEEEYGSHVDETDEKCGY